MRYTGLGHAAIGCSDYEKSLHFYRDILGLKEKFSLYNADGEVWLTYMEVRPGVFVELFPQSKGQKIKYDSLAPMMHVCLLTDDIEKAGRHFQENGLKLYAGPKNADGTNVLPEPYSKVMMKAGEYCFYLDGPDGVPVEVMQYVEPTTLMLMNDEQLEVLDDILKANKYSALIKMPKEYRW